MQIYFEWFLAQQNSSEIPDPDGSAGEFLHILNKPIGLIERLPQIAQFLSYYRQTYESLATNVNTAFPVDPVPDFFGSDAESRIDNDDTTLLCCSTKLLVHLLNDEIDR